MRDTKIERLATVGLLKRCGRKELQDLAELGDDVVVEAGHRITTQGHLNHHCYIVMSGHAEAVVDGEVVGQIVEGDVIGVVGMFDPGDSTATVQTTETTELLVIDHRAFLQALDEVPGLAIAMLHELAHMVRSYAEHMH